MLPRRPLALASLAALVLAGCVAPDGVVPAATTAPLRDLASPLLVLVDNTMAFRESIVAPAVGLAADLYEPTMEVSDTGTIYVAGHVIGAATTGTPAYVSNDDGATWRQLPFLSTIAAPSPLQGSQPPPGDEGVIVAGADGQAWMVDIYAVGYSITGWCEDGARQCYDNRQAYDRVESTTGCSPLSLNDRPWAAYADGSLLLVNNPGGGPMQIGIMDVPPAGEVGLLAVNGPRWNTCASEGGWIPGIPTMRADGLFAVPQLSGQGKSQVMNVVLGNKADIFAVETKEVFPFTSAGGGTSNGGRTAFDAEGTLFVGARNNTADKDGVAEEGRFLLAASADGGATFRTATYTTGTPVRSLYLDGNMAGPGALVTWSQLSEKEGRSDWYVGHASLGPDGTPLLTNVTLAVLEGPHSSAHVMGAAAGPDGRAYFLTFQGAPLAEYVGTTPIRVWVQTEGPTLPTPLRDTSP